MIKEISQENTGHIQENEIAWKAVRLLGFYRLILVCIFLVAFLIFPTNSLLGQSHSVLFITVVNVYLLYALFTIVAVRLRKPGFYVQVYMNGIVDVFFVIACTYSSGGLSSGLGVLAIVSVASVSIFARGRIALAFAAGASLSILLIHSYQVLVSKAQPGDFLQTGLLGMGFFIIAYVANALAKQLKESQELAEKRGVDLANMEQLNDYIIQHMGSGMLVVDEKNQIHLANEAAAYLLGVPLKSNFQSLDHVSAELANQLRLWLENTRYEPKAFRVTGSVAIYPRFTRLGMKVYAGTLILLEDTSILDQQAQHLKMSAMGRLTASIAHEIRNPLGAISHAGQLLEESTNLDKADRRLAQIIREQSVRMNTLIENVMQLSRRDKAMPEQIELNLWLKEFIAEFSRAHDVDAEKIAVHISPIDVKVTMDPSHLHQIMSNLCQNGLRHGGEKQMFEVRGGETRESRGPFLDVIDAGPGIEPETAQQIFEPFFTTASKGTGLGLYIARELAEANQAHLDYVPIPTGGSCFRISFVQKKRRD